MWHFYVELMQSSQEIENKLLQGNKSNCSYPDRAPLTRQNPWKVRPRPKTHAWGRTSDNKAKKAHQKERSPKPKGQKGLEKAVPQR